MRIISQDGTIDVSYENGSLSMSCGKYKDIECARIYYYNLSCPRGTLLAEYKTEAKAIKAMKMLCDKYMRWKCFSVLANGTCEHMENSFSSEEFLEKVVEFCKMNIFQFPKDEEIEVEDE